MRETSSFGYWVRRRRKALDFTQAELGRRVGASAAMIRKIEADERRPSRELAELLAAHLSISSAERPAFLQAARAGFIADPTRLETAAPSVEQRMTPVRTNLPAPMTSMVNRVNDLAQVTALVLRSDLRLLTLLGPPGIGKTRLAIQAAELVLPHFADGAWFVDLSSITDPALIMPTVALTLGLSAVPGLPSDQLVITGLRQKQLLLVLDNLEQVIERAAADVAALLRACRGVKVLATSRVRLDIYGEHEYHLPPMTLPPEEAVNSPESLLDYEAIQLFTDRVRQYRPDFELTAETAAPVLEICHHMDGLPLALEIAAACTRRMPLDALASALRDATGRDWHSLLHMSSRDLLPRQHTLHNAVAWSYSLLDPDTQAFFRQLSVFAGTFDWEAVAAVVVVPSCADDELRRKTLEQLLDQNLVNQVARSPDQWRLLEMIREFARDQLDEREMDGARRRHARYYAARLSELLHHGPIQRYLTQMGSDIYDGRAALQTALETGDVALAQQLCVALEPYWQRRGLLREGRAWLEATLALPGDVDDGLRLETLLGAANMAWMQHDLATAREHASAAYILARDRALAGQQAAILNLQARICLEEGRYEDADALLVEAIDIERSQRVRQNTSFMLIQRGEAALALGRFSQAQALTNQGLSGVSTEDVVACAMAWTNLAEIALARGDTSSARDALIHVLPLAPLHMRRARIFLTAVAGLLLNDGNLPEETAVPAARLLAYIHAANARLGDPLSLLTQSWLSERIAASRRLLSPGRWQAAWEEGQRWTLHEALEVAARALSSATPRL